MDGVCSYKPEHTAGVGKGILRREIWDNIGVGLPGDVLLLAQFLEREELLEGSVRVQIFEAWTSDNLIGCLCEHVRL